MAAEGRGFRIAIVGLPLGLLVMGVASMLWTHFRGDKSDEEVRTKQVDAAKLSRKDINEADLRRFVTVLSEQIGERHLGEYDSLRKAAVWIESTIGQGNIGYETRKQGYQVDGKAVWNVIAELPGKSRRDEVVVIGAHYDTVADCPGANDNGSGVAALLSLAQSFAGNPQERTLHFVAFVNEEPPYFQTDEMGSVVYAKEAKAAKVKITSMISLETIGFYSNEEGSQKYPPGLEEQFPSTGNFIAFVGNKKSEPLVDSARSAFMMGSGVPAMGGAFPEEMPGIGWSDQWAFWQHDYPGIMVTDTAPYRYPHYHKPTDTADKIDFPRMTEVVKGLRSVIEYWANP